MTNLSKTCVNFLTVVAVVLSAIASGCKDDKSSSGSGGAASTSPSSSGSSSGEKITVGLLPKKKGISFFTSCYAGAQEAAAELGNVELVYDGPVDGDPTKAANLVGEWALQGFDVIAVSADDAQILGTAMKKAQKEGVKLVSWDADTPPDSRSFFVSQATPQQIGHALVDALAKDVGGEGEVAIISSSQTSANQNEWMKHMHEHLKAKYPKMTVVATEYPGEDQDKCLSVAKTLLKAHPNLRGMWGISSVAFPGAAEAVQQAGLSGKVKVTGLSTPNPMKPYVKDGTVTSVVLWDTRDLGYLTVYTAEAVASGKLKPGATSLMAGRLKERKVEGDRVLLGDILIFDKSNIDQYDF